MVGGAVGDALGYPVEFIYSFNDIRERYGSRGITAFDTSCVWLDEAGDKALVSDDTQMSLYTAEGLLQAGLSGSPALPAIRDAYLAWWGPQAGRRVKSAYDSLLAEIPALNQRRAPGNTCLTALADIHAGGVADNSSKGCGGVMRVAPVGIFGASHGHTPAATARLAGDAAALTHLHPLSTYSSAALAVIVQLCLESEAVDARAFTGIVERALAAVREAYGPQAPAMERFEEKTRDALRMAASPLPDHEVIEGQLGGGWVAEETLAIALFSVLRHISDFGDCVVCAVNHGGDSDSTGAVAGNIIGAILGLGAIPDRLGNGVQFAGLLVMTADSLALPTFSDVDVPQVSGTPARAYDRPYVPDSIGSLKPGEVFVFGSNLAGHHAGGAARAALDRFGAVWGRGTGLQGRSYAIPTMQGGVETIRPYVEEFVAFAASRPELTFLVTRIGCGIASFTDAEIAPLFAGALPLRNVLLPASFVDILTE